MQTWQFGGDKGIRRKCPGRFRNSVSVSPQGFVLQSNTMMKSWNPIYQKKDIIRYV